MKKSIRLWLLGLGYWLVGKLDDEPIPTSGLNYERAAKAIEAQTTAGKKAYFHFLCDRLNKHELEILKAITHESIRKYPRKESNRTEEVGKSNSGYQRDRTAKA